MSHPGVQLLRPVSSSYAISDPLHAVLYPVLRGESFHTVSNVDLFRNHALLPDERNPQRPPDGRTHRQNKGTTLLDLARIFINNAAGYIVVTLYY